ncbi:MAG: hypothetical protein ACYTGN_09710 [Planctomycetota bacterium]|jgi:hypothetical protein
MRSLILALCCLAACSSSDDSETGNQFVPGGGSAGGGSGVGGGGSGGGGVADVSFDPAYADLGKPGAFPSDLVALSDGRLVTVDDAAIPATIRVYDDRRLLYTVPITAADLIDMDGTQPARSATSFGPGLFGAFTGDIEVVFDRWLLVTVGAGNSVSSDGTQTLRLANLVVIDTQARRVVQTINLAWTLRHAGEFSNGGDYDVIPQSLPVMCRFVPAGNGTLGGNVYVALSNGAGSSAGLGTFFNGTVQSWEANFAVTVPLGIETTGKSGIDVTRTWVSDNYNPVGLTPYATERGTNYLLLTVAGASLFDADFVAQPTTNAFIEFLDLGTLSFRDDYAIDLGQVLPAAPQGIALGEDRNGVSFGMLTSQTFGSAYVVELGGLDSNPVDTQRLRFIRTVDLGGAGFHPSIAVDGNTAVVSSFEGSSLTVLELPDDIEFGTVIAGEPFAAPEAFGIGAVAFANDVVFAVANGNFGPSRNAFLARLGGR